VQQLELVMDAVVLFADRRQDPRVVGARRFPPSRAVVAGRSRGPFRDTTSGAEPGDDGGRVGRCRFEGDARGGDGRMRGLIQIIAISRPAGSMTVRPVLRR